MSLVRIFRRITDIVFRVFLIIATIAMIVLTIVVFVQVASRYVFNSSIAWTEELSRLAFIWASMMATPVALDKGMHASISFIPDRLKGKTKRVYSSILWLLILACAVIITIYGWQLTTSSTFMKTVALRCPMWVQNLPMPIGGVGIALTAVVHILEEIGKKEEA